MNTAAAQSVVQRHPFAFSTVVVSVAGAIELLLKVTHDLTSLHLSVLTIGIISGAVLSLLGAATVTRLGLWGQLGLARRPTRARALLWFLPFLLYGLLPLTRGLDVSAGKAAAAVAFGVLIVFWKLVVLGLVLYALLPRGARSGVVLAALFFAVMHLVAGILTGAVVVPTVLLALSYAFLAFAFGAVRLRTGLLWPLVVCYALLLAAASAVQTGQASNLVASVADVLPPLVISLLLAAYGLAAWPRGRTHTNEQAPAPATTT